MAGEFADEGMMLNTLQTIMKRFIRRRIRYSAENQIHAWLFLAPALGFILVFNVFPLLRIFIMAFQTGSLISSRFNGLKNFVLVLSDPEFWHSIANTAIFAFVTVPVGMVLAMAIALCLNSRLRWRGFFEALFFMPYLTSVVAVGIVFRYLLNKDYGVVNYLLGICGFRPLDFLDNPKFNMPALIIFGVWMSLAFNIIIMLSGLRNIDRQYYQVADLYGASAWERFRMITIPQMIPILTFLASMNLIASFKVYTAVYSLFNGKPGIGGGATTAVFYVFDKFYADGKYGQGMAAAVLLFFIILLFTAMQNLALKALSK